MLAIYEGILYLGARFLFLGILAPCVVALLLTTAAGAAFDFFRFFERKNHLIG